MLVAQKIVLQVAAGDIGQLTDFGGEPGQLVTGRAGCRHRREGRLRGRAFNHALVVYQHSVGSLCLHNGVMPITGENTMHPDFRVEIMKARPAEAHRRADQARLAQAFKQDRPAVRRNGTRWMLRRLLLRPVLRQLAAAVSRAAVDADPAG